MHGASPRLPRQSWGSWGGLFQNGRASEELPRSGLDPKVPAPGPVKLVRMASTTGAGQIRNVMRSLCAACFRPVGRYALTWDGMKRHQIILSTSAAAGTNQWQANHHRVVQWHSHGQDPRGQQHDLCHHSQPQPGQQVFPLTLLSTSRIQTAHLRAGNFVNPDHSTITRRLKT